MAASPAQEAGLPRMFVLCEAAPQVHAAAHPNQGTHPRVGERRGSRHGRGRPGNVPLNRRVGGNQSRHRNAERHGQFPLPLAHAQGHGEQRALVLQDIAWK